MKQKLLALIFGRKREINSLDLKASQLGGMHGGSQAQAWGPQSFPLTLAPLQRGGAGAASVSSLNISSHLSHSELFSQLYSQMLLTPFYDRTRCPGFRCPLSEAQQPARATVCPGSRGRERECVVLSVDTGFHQTRMTSLSIQGKVQQCQRPQDPEQDLSLGI